MKKKKDTDTQATVTFMCPNLRCRKILMAPNRSRGKRVRCSYCGTTLKVPAEKKEYIAAQGFAPKNTQADDGGNSSER